MKYSICVIDDDIPANGVSCIQEREQLNSSNLQYLLRQNEKPWSDPVVKKLVQTLLDEKDDDGTSKWDIFGFTNPAFYVNKLNKGGVNSDIIIFDWDYPGINSENLLLEILEKGFSLIFIFSNIGKKSDIDSIRSKPKFQQYKERLQYLDKSIDGNDQTTILLQQASLFYDSNFSFRFANILRRNSIQVMDKVLSDMGKVSLNDIKNHIIFGDGGKKDFIDFITEKFRLSLASKEFYELVDQIPESSPGSSSLDESVIKMICSYRFYFYHSPGDELVRCGDIVKVGGSFHLVISADCDLGGFWKKNLGIINLVALHELEQTNSSLRDWLTVCVKPKNIPNKPSNLLGKIGELSEGPFVLPFIEIDSLMKNFLVVPKDVISIKITAHPGNWDSMSEAEKSREPMKYSYWNGAERKCSLSEPFLSPVVQHVLNTIAGNGVPDYSDPMKNMLKIILQEFSVPPTPTPTS